MCKCHVRSACVCCQVVTVTQAPVPAEVLARPNGEQKAGDGDGSTEPEGSKARGPELVVQFSNPGLDVDHLSLRIIHEESPVGSKTLLYGNDAKDGTDIVGSFGPHYFFRTDLG